MAKATAASKSVDGDIVIGDNLEQQELLSDADRLQSDLSALVSTINKLTSTHLPLPYPLPKGPGEVSPDLSSSEVGGSASLSEGFPPTAPDPKNEDPALVEPSHTLASAQIFVTAKIADLLRDDPSIQMLLQLLAELSSVDGQVSATGNTPLLQLSLGALASKEGGGIKPLDDNSNPDHGPAVPDGGTTTLQGGGGGDGGTPSGGSGGWYIGISCTGGVDWQHQGDGGFTIKGDSPGTHVTGGSRP